MSLYIKGLKEALTYSKKRYNNVIYEKQGPTPPKENRPIYSKLDEHAKVKRKSKTNLSLFG